MASNEYATAASYLSKRMGILPEPEYVRLRAQVEEARKHAEYLRDALLRHMKEHGC